MLLFTIIGLLCLTVFIPRYKDLKEREEMGKSVDKTMTIYGICFSVGLILFDLALFIFL